MKLGFIFVGLLLVFSLVSAEQIYKLDLDICKNDTVILNHFEVSSGSISSFPQVGDEVYEFRIVSTEGHELFSEEFKLNFVTYPFMGPDATGPDIVDINVVRYSWKLPYFENAWKIQLYHGNKKIFEYELPLEEAEDSELEISEPAIPGSSGPEIHQQANQEEEGGLCFLSLVLLLSLLGIVYVQKGDPR